jgi:phage baseplate assembly protein W
MSLNITFEKTQKSDYVYSDLHLDLTKSIVPNGEKALYRVSGNADIKTDFDEFAIANSIRNLFTTRPLQRILDPTYGLDLSQFLFESANEYTARLIAKVIIRGIEKFEPRVTVNSVDIQVDAEYNRYSISLFLYIPTINRQVQFTTALDNGVFAI